MKEQIQSLIKVFKSFFQDLKSLDKIKQNRWHLHIPIGLLLGIVTQIILVHTFDGVELVAQAFISSFLTLGICIAFEWAQQVGRIIEAKERFESNKDVVAGALPALITIIITIIIQNI